MDLPRTIEYIRPSVVQILVHNAILGTGFFVDDLDHLITAKHVVDGGRSWSKKAGVPASFAAGLAVAVTRGFTIFGAEVLNESPINDLALLRLRREEAGPGPLYRACDPDPQRPLDGMPVAVSGYPLQADVLVTNAGSIASAWLDDRGAAALLQLQNSHSHEPVDRYLADLEVSGGNSGGPVYRADTGGVIGVCVATENAFFTQGDQTGEPAVANGRPLAHRSGFTIVIPSRYVVEFLRTSGITWVESQAIAPTALGWGDELD